MSSKDPEIGEVQLKELESLYKLLDTNQDGVLDKHEFRQLLTMVSIEVNHTEELTELMWAELCTEKGDQASIKFEDFKQLMASGVPKLKSFSADKLVAAFETLGGRNGAIRVKELTRLLRVYLPTEAAPEAATNAGGEAEGLANRRRSIDRLVDTFESDFNGNFNYSLYAKNHLKS
mmetsp:Transcript_43143/g.84575  ORF Transcript_43143/g.84575 Transcript_43143/m.84575 type:complete len:176 (-) Transcript_43143:119-646(-)|eukprot:CAMPEP_0175146332 /NCGR_PEP_ID=MMETSP0087-20121206/15325_1 /TAXON_ID=136419 /ORGANISM="Unknown Unknown, Strain D1" /LENGTH=175 /DNA_ID=CAMNT_0016431293 /DNA_START=46 /DNA_END=573 /DNA_ORIENTATION=-